MDGSPPSVASPIERYRARSDLPNREMRASCAGYEAASMVEIVSLEGDERSSAVPILIDSFTGIYRWHAKRTLREATWVRAARDGSGLLGVALLERLTEEVGYVYYVAVLSGHRGQKVGGALLDDALTWLKEHGARIVYAVVTEDNPPSEGLFRSRGFRVVERKERGYQEGGLGAWGLRSRMRIVAGEVLMGRLIASPSVLQSSSPRLDAERGGP